MKKWHVYKRGNLFRVGRWYQTFFLRRWNIEWHGWTGGTSNIFSINEYYLQGNACTEAKILNEKVAQAKVFEEDYWKPIACD